MQYGNLALILKPGLWEDGALRRCKVDIKKGDICVINSPLTSALVKSSVNQFFQGRKLPKCTLLQALRLCTGRVVQRVSRGVAVLFLDHGTRRGEGSASLPGRSLPPGKTRYPFYRRLAGSQGRYGQVRKISPSIGIRSSDRPARSQSLYRLH